MCHFTFARVLNTKKKKWDLRLHVISAIIGMIHSSCVKIDEDYLKCMPVFTSPKCSKKNFFPFSSYAFKKYIENGELHLANVQNEFCKENRAQLQPIRSHKLCINFKETSLEWFMRGIKCYSSRGVNNILCQHFLSNSSGIICF